MWEDYRNSGVRWSAELAGREHATVPLAGCASGIYVLVIRSGDHVEHRRIVVTR